MGQTGTVRCYLGEGGEGEVNDLSRIQFQTRTLTLKRFLIFILILILYCQIFRGFTSFTSCLLMSLEPTLHLATSVPPPQLWCLSLVCVICGRSSL